MSDAGMPVSDIFGFACVAIAIAMAVALVFARRQTAMERLALRALRLTELAEDIAANCQEHPAEMAPETCEICVRSADAARLARMAVLGRARAEGRLPPEEETTA